MKILLIVFLAISDPEQILSARNNSKFLRIGMCWRYHYICNGALISLRHVLTAGHCVLDMDAVPLSDLSVVSGANDRFARGTGHEIKRIIHPAFYEPLMRYRNVAVLTLSKPARGVFLTPLKTIDVSTNKADYSTVSKYFAYDTIPDGRGKHRLRKIFLLPLHPQAPVVLRNPIRDVRPPVYKFFGKHESGQKLEITDLGGPLVQNGKIIGIASTIEKWDKRSEFPEFTEAHVFSDFIDNAKKCEDSSCSLPGCIVHPYDAAFLSK